MTKDHCTACACLLFCGPCGGHRCYLGDCCCGVLYFLTFGCAYIGVIADCCYLGTMVQAANLKYAGSGEKSVVVQNVSISQAQMSPPQAQLQVSPPPMYAPPPQQVYMATPAIAEWQQQGPIKGAFCTHCGAPKNGNFCANCGRQ